MLYYLQLHSGNYTGYTYSQSNIDNKLSGYLPLSGGTMTSNSKIKWGNNVQSWDDLDGGFAAVCTVRENDYYAGLSFKGWYGFQIRTYGGNTDLFQVRGASNDAWGTWKNLIHSGNIGSQTVAGLIQQSVTDLNNVAKGTIFKSSYGPSNAPETTARYYNGICFAADNNNTYRCVLALSTAGLAYSRIESGGTWGEWKQIAYTDSNITGNAGSATKLQTARTIWGQSFDGTGDVSGNLVATGITCDHITRYDSNAGYLFGSRNTALGLTDGGALVYAYGNTPISMYTNGLERARVTGSGNILIGTTIDSGARLHINASAATTLQAVTTTTGLGIAQFLAPNAKTGVTGGMAVDFGVASSTYNSGNIAFRHYSSGNAANFVSIGLYGNDNILNVFGSGNVAIGTTDSNPAYKLDVQGGDVRFTGNLVVYGGGAFGSDVRYKDILDYTNIDLATIADAPLFTYQWNDREDKKVYLGTSAQYWMETTFKDAVNTSNPNFYHLDYGALGVGLAIATARKVVDHEERIATLEKENKELKKKLNKYETLWHN